MISMTKLVPDLVVVVPYRYELDRVKLKQKTHTIIIKIIIYTVSRKKTCHSVFDYNVLLLLMRHI